MIIAAVALVPSRTASAHAELLSSDPPAGAQLVVAPAAVTLRFNESVTFVPDAIRVIDASGATITGVGVPIHPDGDATLSAALPALADGGYVVAWNVVSADGHPLNGAFTFVVGSGVAPDASVVAGASVGGGSDSAGVVLKVLRGLGYIGLTLSIGLWAFVLLIDRRAKADRVLTRVGRVGWRARRRLVVGSHPSPGGVHRTRLASDRPAGHRHGMDRTGRHRRRPRDLAARLGACRAERARRRARRAGRRCRRGRRLWRSRCGWSAALVGARRDGCPRGRGVGLGRRACRTRPSMVRQSNGSSLGRGGTVLDRRHGRRGRRRRLRGRAIDPPTRHMVGGDRHRLRQDLDREGRAGRRVTGARGRESTIRVGANAAGWVERSPPRWR